MPTSRLSSPSSSLTILVIAYRYPPSKGVGARRWAKMSKYLGRDGVRMHIFSADLPGSGTGTVEMPANIVSERVPTGLPRWYWGGLGLVGKFLRLVYRFVSSVLYPDYSISWVAQLSPRIRKALDSDRFDAVILSGPPFGFFAVAGLIRRRYPGIAIVLDYRDPWNGHRHYESPVIGRFALSRSNKIETGAIRVANAIVVVSADMASALSARHSSAARKIQVIRNGYDPEDAEILSQEWKPAQSVAVFYGGILGKRVDGRLGALLAIAKAIREFERKGREIAVHCTIFSDVRMDSTLVHAEFDEKHFTFLPMQTTEDYFRAISRADLCLSINDKRDPHAFGSKVFDYMAMRKPIALISPEGELRTFLDGKGQLTSGYDDEGIFNLVERLSSRQFSVAVGGYPEFNFESLARTYYTLLLSLGADRGNNRMEKL